MRSNTASKAADKATGKAAGNIVFLDPDDPRAGDSLRAALSHASNIPVLGLVLKVDASDEIVNWMFADETTIKSLTLILPPQ